MKCIECNFLKLMVLRKAFFALSVLETLRLREWWLLGGLQCMVRSYWPAWYNVTICCFFQNEDMETCHLECSRFSGTGCVSFFNGLPRQELCADMGEKHVDAWPGKSHEACMRSEILQESELFHKAKILTASVQMWYSMMQYNTIHVWI